MKYITTKQGTKFVWQDESGLIFPDRVLVHCVSTRGGCYEDLIPPRSHYIEIHLIRAICPGCGQEKEVRHNESGPSFVIEGNAQQRQGEWYYQGCLIFIANEE